MLRFLCTMCIWNWNKNQIIQSWRQSNNNCSDILYALSGSLFVWNTCALSLEDINICPYLNKYQSIKLMNYPQQKMSWFLVAWVVAYTFFLIFFCWLSVTDFLPKIVTQLINCTTLLWNNLFWISAFQTEIKTINKKYNFPHSRSEPCACCFWFA